MAEVRYYVFATHRDESNTWEHSYYGYAPAFFLARNPTAEEKLALVQQLIARYTPRVLSAKPFQCIVCDAVATKSLMLPTYALHDPSLGGAMSHLWGSIHLGVFHVNLH